ncbi:MAG: formylglycine-generating enzyme family protein [Acidimicrobiia bacterium]|nr:formylglycine-generating enzyme family protein [Acidimicrobiia bacterium]
MKAGACCTPEPPDRVSPPAERSGVSVGGDPGELIELPGGAFTMGSDRVDYPGDGEGPARPVTVSPFAIAPTTVTNAEFAAFVEATGHRTDAESFGWSFVFAFLLPDDFAPTRAMVGAEWWRQVEGADWAHPEGPHSSIDDRADHPAVHVSWNDAQAYCTWTDTRLPTEAEWEYASRGGYPGGGEFPWGDELEPDGAHMMNVWQGRFPFENTLDDGWMGTAPARSFPPNGYGLYNVCGNVWEWCQDVFVNRHDTAPTTDPLITEGSQYRVVKGGSYLCHASYCRRYRITARSHNAADSSTGNTGLRVARAI